MIAKRKLTFHFIGNDIKDGRLRRIEVKSVSVSQAEKAAKARLKEPRIVPAFS